MVLKVIDYKNKALTESGKGVLEGCWLDCCCGVTTAAPWWLLEDIQGCPAAGTACACSWDIGWNCDDELTLFCGWTKEGGAYWNNSDTCKRVKCCTL